MEVDPPGYLWSKYELFERYTPLEKLSRNSVKNFVVNSTNMTDMRTDVQMDEQKGENYIPLDINAGGIISKNFGNTKEEF